MSKQPPRRPAGKNRPQQRKGRTAVAAKGAKKQTDRTLMIITGIVVAVGIALVIAFAGGADKPRNGEIIGDVKASAGLVSKVTGIKSDVFDKVGEGTVLNLPKKVTGPPLKADDGKPRVVYLGSNYCPFCATERWAMVQAFSRFGTFKDLRITSSAKVTQVGSPESFPNTASFSFHNSTYSSPYLVFEPVEQQDNKYKTLDKASAEQEALGTKYGTGSIPFIDFANQYVVSGASYDAKVLTDKSHDEIADAMGDPSTEISQGAVGTANAITAAICKITDNKPDDVCGVAAVKAIAAKI